MGKTRRSPVTPMDRALDAVYADIPAIPDCDGSCSDACGPISMSAGEWERIQRRGPVPPVRDELVCPLLTATGRCRVYSIRPWICRIWGSVPAMPCHRGCQPERWLTGEEAVDLFNRVMEAGGHTSTGPFGGQAAVRAIVARHGLIKPVIL